jgi:hypothetical protein
MNRKGVSFVISAAIILILAIAFLFIFMNPLGWAEQELSSLTTLNECEITGGHCYATDTCGGHALVPPLKIGCPKALPYCCRLDFDTFEEGSLYLLVGTEPKSLFKLRHGAAEETFMDAEAVSTGNQELAETSIGIPKNSEIQLRYRAGRQFQRALEENLPYCAVALSHAGKRVYTGETYACRSLTELHGFVDLLEPGFTHETLIENAEDYTCGREIQKRCEISLQILGGEENQLAPVGEPFTLILSGKEA